MNNEPVAWMELYYREPNNLSWTDAELKDSGEVYKTVPLYTHPVKELTDEEIYEVWKKAMQEEAKIEYSIYATQLERQPFVFFARAILRKAQEKCTK